MPQALENEGRPVIIRLLNRHHCMWQELRYAARTLRRAPMFAATAVLTLGAGLGLNATLFTLFNAYVLRPVAVRDPYSLYELGWNTKRASRHNFTWDQYQTIRTEAPLFSDATASAPMFSRVEQRNLLGMLVSGNYFSMLGAGTMMGRPILPDDASAPGGRPVVVLTYQIWNAVFGQDPNILGRKISINGHKFEVVGVCTPDYTGIDPVPIDFFAPITMQSALSPGRDLFGPENPALIHIAGRLRPGISVDQAQAALTVFVKHATEQLSESERSIQATLTSKATALPLNAMVMAAFLPLIAAFVLVLLICCANVSNMMLARAVARQREIGVRLSLGAGRFRLVRQLLSESLLLALLAGAVGFSVSYVTLSAGQQLLFRTFPPSFAKLIRFIPLTPDYRVFLFIVLAAAFSTIFFGLAPALQATGTSLVNALRGEFSAHFRASRLRNSLVISQITVCLILVVLTGILLRTSSAYQQIDLGYSVRGVVFPIIFGRAERALTVKLARDLKTQPWVDFVAAARRVPLGDSLASIAVAAERGKPVVSGGYNLVSSEYFEVFGIPIRSGRNFSNEETNSEAAVAIVSQSTAHRIWPGEDALGKTIYIEKDPARPDAERPLFDHALVIGIAKDVISGQVWDGPDPTMLYFPASANSRRSMTLLIRGKDDTNSTRRLFDASLARMIPDQAAVVSSLEDGFVLQVYPFRAASWIGYLLGAVALALTLSGMYGVMSYLVSQRTKEIGIRMALGATPGSVVRLILGDSLRLAAAGLGLGLLVSLGTSRLLHHWLSMLKAYDVLAYSTGLTIVLVAAVAAAFFPSTRASHINPVDTLRAD